MDAFAYPDGDLNGQGPWVATAQPSLELFSSGGASSSLDDTTHSSKVTFPGVAPRFNQAWFLEAHWQTNLINADLTVTQSVAISVGILAISMTMVGNAGTTNAQVTAWGVVCPLQSYNVAGPNFCRLEYDGAGTMRVFFNGVLIQTSAQAPGNDQPDTLTLSNRNNAGGDEGLCAEVSFGFLVND